MSQPGLRVSWFPSLPGPSAGPAGAIGTLGARPYSSVPFLGPLHELLSQRQIFLSAPGNEAMFSLPPNTLLPSLSDLHGAEAQAQSG